jgi:hypothetical protein
MALPPRDADSHAFTHFAGYMIDEAFSRLLAAIAS